MLTSKYYDDHDKRGSDIHYVNLHDDPSNYLYIDRDGNKYQLVPAPEPVDIAALRDAAIDAFLIYASHNATATWKSAQSAARAWAAAAGHGDQ